MQVTNLLFEEHRHEYHDLEGLLGFYLWYAFGGIVLLVVIAKVLRRILMRPENYYDV
jgi:quinol-cytochrome oxidoreductase complex cytochrome b subunit